MATTATGAVRAARQQQVDEAIDIGGVLGGSLPIAAGRCLRVEFLPLVDIQQQPVRLAFRPIQFFTDHVGQQLGITRPQLVRLVGDFRLVFCGALVVAHAD